MSRKYNRKKKPPKSERKRLSKYARWMREGSQTFHEEVTKFILDDICESLFLTPINQKIFYDWNHKKWYIADFFIKELRLVIEIDGPIHNKQVSYDLKRTKFLESNCCRVVRFKNEEVESLNYRSKLTKTINFYLDKENRFNLKN